MDILFTGGASLEPISIQPLDLTKLRCKVFGCKDDAERVSGTTTPRYCEKVLIGNWYEDQSKCHRSTDEFITVYNTDYKTHQVKDLKDDMYTIWKNKEKTQGSGRKLCIDGESYNDNMTSLYDLSFRILPKDLCGPRVRVYNARKNVWVPETELAVSYGNQTKHGLADAMKKKQENMEKELPLQSIYQIDYVEQTSPKQEHEKRPRGDMNTPDLRHLGIDLSSRPTPREPQYRSSCCEKICAWL